jgi:hypothetical protein
MWQSKFYYTLVSLFVILNHCTGQTDSIKTSDKFINQDKRHFILSTGFVYDERFWGDIGIVYAKTNNTDLLKLGLAGYRLGTEFTFAHDKFLLGPKISAEVDFWFFGMRMNIIDYTDFTYHDLKLTPEIGLTLDGQIDIFYGYNISLSESNIPYVGDHRLTVTLNFDRIYWNFLN